MGMRDSPAPSRIGYDPDAFERFYRDHIERLTRFVARRVDDPHLVADLVSETFLAAIDSADRYHAAAGSPTAWLYGIARNLLMGELRRRGRELRATCRVGGRRLLDPQAITRLEEQIDAELGVREVIAVLDCLPEGDRQLFELVALDGLDLNDVAQVIGVKPGTARVRLHRSRARVRAALDARPDPAILSEVHP